MKKWYKHCFVAVSILLALGVSGQSIYSFSGSSKGDNSNFNFYSPLVSGSQTFSNNIFSSGPAQLLTDTTAIFDTTLQTYDIDSIPEQLIFYNNPCRFYIKSDSLNQAGSIVTGRSYYVVSGNPLGVVQFNRLNQFQYTTNVDTLDFYLQFALVTTTGDTVKAKRSTKFKLVPSLPYENATFGIGGQQGMPDAEGYDFRVLSQDSSQGNPNSFNFRSSRNLSRKSYSGVKVVLENGGANQLHLLSYNYGGSFHIDTLNIYAESLIVKGGFHFPGTTINIYARDIIFQDLPGNPAYLNTTPLYDTIGGAISGNGKKGQRGGDINLHVLNFTANPGKRFILNGGDGQPAAVSNTGGKMGTGGDGGNLYATVDVGKYLISEGGYSGNRKYDPTVPYKGNKGNFVANPDYASWLHPNFLHIIKNYNKTAFYQGVTVPVVKNLSFYSNALDVYASDGSLFAQSEDNVLQFRQIADEINEVFYNIGNNLDYFGNPPGWVPMLSFEFTKTAYKSSIDHALNVMFLDKLVQHANNNLLNRTKVFQQLRAEVQTIVNDNVEQFHNLDAVVIPGLRDKIQENQGRIDALKQELVRINEELDRRAKGKYDERSTWKWVGVAGKVLSSIPTPYTQAAGAALSVGTQVFGNEDQKAGFEQGGALAGVITNTLQPFVSGQFGSQVSTLYGNVSTGVSGIFTQIGNASNLSDAKQIKANAEALYDNNKELYGNISQSVNGVVDLFNKVTRVDGDELGSIKGELLANEPRIGIIAEEMKNIADDQQRLGHELETSTQELLGSNNAANTGLTAISSFNEDIFQSASAYDHKLSVFSHDMRMRVFDRLRKYRYYMLKAYEYRTLDNSLGSLWGFDPTSMLTKIDKLINDDPAIKSLSVAQLSDNQRDELRSVYDEEMHQIADKIYDDYISSDQAARSATSRLRLTRDEVRDLNLGKTITVNLVQRGIFPAASGNYREDLRLNDLPVTRAVLKNTGNPNNASYDILTFKFEYPNYSRIKKNGMIYAFNNYNLHTTQPISWATDYDVIDQKLTPVPKSSAASSLLNSLFEGSKAQGNAELYAKPAAWADIKLSMSRTTDGNSAVMLDSLVVDVNYDFQYKPTNIVNVELNTNNKWFAPTFQISRTDNNNKKSGIGNVHRTYTTSTQTVTATTPEKYGRYTFTNWADGLTEAAVINGNGINIDGGNTISFSLAVNRSFKAMYKFDGPVVSLPDTVYLGDTSQYSIEIKNTGSGLLFWELDSMSNWIKYPLKKTGVNDSTITLNFEMNPDVNNRRVGVLDVSSLETELLHNYVYFVQNPGKAISSTTYTFIGNGNWDNPANWSNIKIPPSVLPSGSQIVINPAGNGECIMNVVQWLSNGSTMTIAPGKRYRVTGSLEIQH